MKSILTILIVMGYFLIVFPASAGTQVTTKCVEGYLVVTVINKYKMNSFQLKGMGNGGVRCPSPDLLKAQEKAITEAQLAYANAKAAMTTAKAKLKVNNVKAEVAAQTKQKDYSTDGLMVIIAGISFFVGAATIYYSRKKDNNNVG